MSERFVPVGFAAHVAGRSHRTVRTWARAGAIRHRTSADGLEVHVGDVARESRDRPRRNRARLA